MRHLHRPRLLLVLSLLTTVAFLHSAYPAVTVATSYQAATYQVDVNLNFPYTPTYTVPANDVLLGLSPATVTGSFSAAGNTGGVSVLTDGVYGTMASTSSRLNLATVGGGSGSGTMITYSLNLASATYGYDISSIVTLNGWPSNGRDQQLYTVSYATLADPLTFIDITTVNYNPPVVSSSVPTANQVIVSDDAAAYLAQNVVALRFNFMPSIAGVPTSPENGYVGVAELAAIGIASVPEPNSVALLVSAMVLGSAVNRRSRQSIFSDLR